MEQTHEELPVFYDVSGKRWHKVQTAAAILSLLITITGVGLLSALRRPTLVPRHETNTHPINDAYTWSPPVLERHMFTYLHDRDQRFANLPVSANYPLMSVTAIRTQAKSPADIAYSIDRANLPIIGEGPMVRVVKLEHSNGLVSAIEPYSGKTTKQLNHLEQHSVSSSSYALERYGESYGRKIAMTFDDGPDDAYTPALLDLLAAENVAATFFVNGENVVRFPDTTKRMVSEGHVVANHTFSHIDFDFHGPLRTEQEIVQTERILRAVTAQSSGYFRLPYGGNDEASLRDNIRGILEAQRLGYTIASFHFDTNDWAFPYGAQARFPGFDGSDKVLLLHDGGGNRLDTLKYVATLIANAKAAGYSFTTLDGLYSGNQPALTARVQPSLTDKISLAAANAVYVWPQTGLQILFYITLASIFITSIVNVILAVIQTIRTYLKNRTPHTTARYRPLVSIIVPAYNEESVVAMTVRSLLKSTYRRIEILLVDDGSKDATWHAMQKAARGRKRVRAYSKPNGGKSSALNFGIERAEGEIIVAMDADTIFMPDTIARLIRHFADPTVGAVAGVVKVGNVRNALTAWQSLEYITGINIQRSAQALMNAITIVPGACGAWRKEAVIAAGGFSHRTLAEDCDLTLMVRKAGYRVTQDTAAVSLTESPEKLKDLAKQRFRWMFGNIQAFWKHRDMLLRRRYGWLGMFVLPNAIISILFPLLFIPLLLSITIENILAGQYMTLAFYFVITLVIQFLLSMIGIVLAGEPLRLLRAVLVARILYGPLRSYLLYRSVLTVFRGAHVGWNKLARTGNVKYTAAATPQTASSF